MSLAIDSEGMNHDSAVLLADPGFLVLFHFQETRELLLNYKCPRQQIKATAADTPDCDLKRIRTFPTESPKVQALTQEHFVWASRFYISTMEVYSGLGASMLSILIFRRLYDSYHKSLATFLAAAMQAHADREL